MWKEAQWARKGPVNLNVKSHLSSSSHVSHSRQSVKKSWYIFEKQNLIVLCLQCLLYSFRLPLQHYFHVFYRLLFSHIENDCPYFEGIPIIAVCLPTTERVVAMIN